MKQYVYIVLLIIGAITLSFSRQTKMETKNNVSDEQRDTLPHSPFDSLPYLDEKALLDYIQITPIIQPKVSNGAPFDKLDYNKIIAYDFEGEEEAYPNVIDERKGKFVPVILRQQFLTQKQADNILSTLTKSSAYGETTAACFQPHFALVFFKDDKKVNQISVCLDCNYLESEIAIPAQTYKKVNKGTKEEYALIGFSKTGRKAIIDLCTELKFTYGHYDVKAFFADALAADNNNLFLFSYF